MWKNNWPSLLFIFLLGSFCALLLFFVQLKTQPLIQAHEDNAKKKAILNALNLPENGTPDLYDELPVGTITCFRSKSDQALAFSFSGSGLWGPIRGILSLEPDLKTIRKIIVLKQEETPGLGGRIGENAYLTLFQGKLFEPELKIIKKARAANEIEALSGATLTSNAFETLLNKAYHFFRQNLPLKNQEKMP